MHARAGLLLLLLEGCATPRPLPTAEPAVLAQVRFDRVFPERDVGLVRPRFGAPAIVSSAGSAPSAGNVSFPIALLERSAPRALAAALVRPDATTAEAARCVDARLPRPDDCVPLALADDERTPIADGEVLRVLMARTAVAPGARGYDLVLRAGDHALERAPRAVFVREGEPSELSVVQLSDLHVGRGGQAQVIADRLERAVREINASAPDLVIVTGDLAEQGRSRVLEQTARDALLRLDAPVLVVPGNHDYGHFPRLLHPTQPDAGYDQFARTFHPLRRFRVVLGEWEFLGFDSGPSVFSPLIHTRGVDDETLGWLRERVRQADEAGHGVVLFSHAPTRAALSDRATDRGSHLLGTMVRGAEAIEALLVEASRRGQRAVHLSGHTHWSDMFVEDAEGWARVPFSRLPCPVTPGARAALINAPSATRVSFHTLRHGGAWGWVQLHLDHAGVHSRFVLHSDGDGDDRALACR
jgi:alkaline phosphatase D